MPKINSSYVKIWEVGGKSVENSSEVVRKFCADHYLTCSKVSRELRLVVPWGVGGSQGKGTQLILGGKPSSRSWHTIVCHGRLYSTAHMLTAYTDTPEECWRRPWLRNN